MSLVISQADHFWADLLRQVDWYRERAGSEVAVGYVDAVEYTLHDLSRTPGLAWLRFEDWLELAGIRSWRVRKPYNRHLIFYRVVGQTLMAERILHGARDLPRRLLTSPYEDD